MAVKTFHFRVDGLEAVLKRIKGIEPKIADEIDEELNKAARNVAQAARARAPKGKSGKLVGSISANTSQKFRKEVLVGANYGAYVDFGTGSGFDKGPYAFTSEEKVFAKRFYVSGKGKMVSRPYLFVSFAEEKPKIEAAIKKIMFDV